MKRRVTGEVVLPDSPLPATARRILVEVRDVSEADAPSRVVAKVALRDVALTPGGVVPFALSVPEVAEGRSLSVRVHVDVDGTQRVTPGDLLSRSSIPVEPAGEVAPLRVPVAPT